MNPLKSDPTTKVLLGVIATGVAALTALAFEKRYLACRSAHPSDELEDATDHAYDRISRKTKEMGRNIRDEAHSLKDRVEDGVDVLREKASNLKDRVSDGLERAGTHLRDGAEKLKDGLASGAANAKDGAENASEEARKAFDSSKI